MTSDEWRRTEARLMETMLHHVSELERVDVKLHDKDTLDEIHHHERRVTAYATAALAVQGHMRGMATPPTGRPLARLG